MSKKHKTPTQSPRGPSPTTTTDAAAGTSTSDGGSNGFLQRRLGLQAGGEDTEGESEKSARVILSAKKGGSPFSKEFWTELDVGHCWVDVVTPEGRKDSWGYTADNPRDFPRTQPWKSVAGKVLHPDGSRGATGTLARDITPEQLGEGEDWGNAAGDTYNLFGLDGGHSCATFAKGFFEAATGESAPTGMFGALIANPNDLSAAMNEQAEKEREQESSSSDAELANT